VTSSHNCVVYLFLNAASREMLVILTGALMTVLTGAVLLWCRCSGGRPTLQGSRPAARKNQSDAVAAVELRDCGYLLAHNAFHWFRLGSALCVLVTLVRHSRHNRIGSKQLSQQLPTRHTA
jgi:hypothetical protein